MAAPTTITTESYTPQTQDPVVTTPTIIRKNSGILRYAFGLGLNAQQIAIAGGTGYVVRCMSASSIAFAPHYDIDQQAFGMSPGCPAITGVGFLASGFGVANPTAFDAEAIGNEQSIQYPPDSADSGNGGAQRYPACGRIPAGTKLSAWFAQWDATTGASTATGDQPLPAIQWEMRTNTPRIAGVLGTSQPSYVSSIRVAVANLGAAATAMIGILYVQLQHSYVDLPGLRVNAGIAVQSPS